MVGGVVGGADGEGDAGDAPGNGGPVCVVGDALRTGGRGPERGLPWVLRVMVALVMPVVGVSLVMDRVTVLLVMSMVGGGCLWGFSRRRRGCCRCNGRW